GNTGQAVARRLRGFGCRVLAYDKYRPPQAEADARRVELDELRREAEVVSFHVPLTDETRGWVDATFLARFARPVWLVNAARGEILRLDALADALDTGRVRGAVLDVLENERLEELLPAQRVVFDRLAASERVWFTPHVAGWTHESYLRINEVLVDKLGRYLHERHAAGMKS
ncbi:MAG: NAD(P)-dependent oxidoreductase, partial [Catalinimonas sp.]